MATRQLSLLLEQLRKTIRRQLAGGLADGALLDRFVQHRDEAAFEVLVWRHGPLVLSLCHRLLHHWHDAEDALQATFLTLVKKAGAIGKRESLGSWLYKVAYRIALRMMEKTRKTKPSTDPMQDMPAAAPADTSCSDRQALLDDAIGALPEKYRTAVVLCYLQGKSQKEIAEELGCPLKTISTRLARARQMLRKYLARRGAPLTAGLLGAALAQRAVSAPVGPLLVIATVKAATNVAAGHALTGLVPARVAALTEGVRTMFLGKLKAATVAVLVVAAVLFLRPVWTPIEAGGGQATGTAAVRQEDPPQKRRPDKESAKVAPITKEARQAIDAALTYLVRKQYADGAWGTGNLKGNGVTGVVGLAFLAAGHSPGQGPYGAALGKAIYYVVSKESRNPPGYLGDMGRQASMYNHGYAVLFLAEAHKVIPDKKKKEQVKELLQRAVKVIVEAQNNAGAWRYEPRPVDGDLTITACQLHALRAARDAGIDVPNETLEKAVRFILACQYAKDGGFRYMPQFGNSGFARSAMALSALRRAGAKEGQHVKQGLEYLRQFKPGAEQAAGAQGLYLYFGHYYAAQVLARDQAWPEWYPAIRAELLRLQANGAWDDQQFCPHLNTALAVMILQTPDSRLGGAPP